MAKSLFLWKCPVYRLTKQTRSSMVKYPFLFRSSSSILKPSFLRHFIVAHPLTSFYQCFWASQNPFAKSQLSFVYSLSKGVNSLGDKVNSSLSYIWVSLTPFLLNLSYRSLHLSSPSTLSNSCLAFLMRASSSIW